MKQPVCVVQRKPFVYTLRESFFLCLAFLLSISNLAASEPKSPKAMTETDLLNANYVIDHHKVQLHDGKAWHSGSPKDGWDILSGSAAFGDIDGDGKTDGAIILMHESKAKGPMLHLAVMIDKNGSPKQIADITLGNNKGLKTASLAISEGTIHLNLLDHQPKDKVWEPSRPVACQYKLVNGKLERLAPKLIAIPGSALILQSETLNATGTASDVVSAPRYESSGPDIISAEPISMHQGNVIDVSEHIVKNARFLIEKQTAQLKNGSASGTFKKEGGHWSASTETIALGDLNGDKHADAVAILVYNGGGNGFFYYLVPVVTNGGKLFQVGNVGLGDRINVNSLKIVSGVIEADLTVHGPDDAMVNPTQKVKWKFKLVSGKLTKLP